MTIMLVNQNASILMNECVGKDSGSHLQEIFEKSLKWVIPNNAEETISTIFQNLLLI